LRTGGLFNVIKEYVEFATPSVKKGKASSLTLPENPKGVCLKVSYESNGKPLILNSFSPNFVLNRYNSLKRVIS
jgi:hypothetical protein